MIFRFTALNLPHDTSVGVGTVGAGDVAFTHIVGTSIVTVKTDDPVVSPSLLLTPVATSNDHLRHNFSASHTEWGARLYFRTPSAWMGAAYELFSLRTSSAPAMKIAITGTGQPGRMRMVSATGAQFQSNSFLATDTWYRLESYGHTNGASSDGRLYVYDMAGALLWDSGVQTQDYGANYDRFVLGHSLAAPADVSPFQIARIEVAADADTMIGPYKLFSEDFTGVDASPWDASKWVLGKDATAGGVVDIQSNQGRILTGNSGSGENKTIARRMNVGQLADFDVTFKFVHNNNISLRFVYRATATALSFANGYVLLFDLNIFKLSRYNSFTETNIAPAPHSGITNGGAYWIRLRVSGDSHQAKYWADGDSEPDTWTLSGTDSDLAAPGYLGFRATPLPVSLNSQTLLLDDITMVEPTEEPEPPTGPAWYVWNGTIKVPASGVYVWDGTTKHPMTSSTRHE